MKITFKHNVSVATLTAALALAQDIESKQAKLQALLTNDSVRPLKAKRAVKRAKKSNRFSPAQRAKISAGLKRKWAERRAAKNTPTQPPTGTVQPATA